MSALGIVPVLAVDVVEELVEARVAELVDRIAVDVPLVVRPVRLEPCGRFSDHTAIV